MEIALCVIIGIAISFLIIFVTKPTPSRPRTLPSNRDYEYLSWKLTAQLHNDPILIIQQKEEDRKQYEHYELNRISAKQKAFEEDWVLITKFMQRNPNFLTEITPEDMEEGTTAYNEYVRIYKLVMPISPCITKEAFVTRRKNPWICMPSLEIFNPSSPFYTIYHEPTARYAGGSVIGQIRKEFKEKWGFE